MSYQFRSADKADDKHLFSCSLDSLAWKSLAASVVIMVYYVLWGRGKTETSARKEEEDHINPAAKGTK